MAKLNFLVICENAFLAEATRNLNLIGIFDTINASKFPALQPRLAIAVRVTADNEGKHQISILIKKGDKKILENNFEFEGIRHQIINNFQNFNFPEKGDYVVEVNLDGIVIGFDTIFLNQVGNP